MTTVAGPERSLHVSRYRDFPESNGLYDHSLDYYHYTINYWRYLEGILDRAKIPQALIEIAQEFENVLVLRRREFQRYYRYPNLLLLRKGPLLGYSSTSVHVKDIPDRVFDNEAPTFEIWNSTLSEYPHFVAEVEYPKKPHKYVMSVGKEGLVEKIREVIPAAFFNTHFWHVFSYGPLHSERVSWEEALKDGKFYKQLYP